MINIRIGFGYDVHRFEYERELWLGGVKIAHCFGLLGHSDADVLIHALCDALLGAANLRDIGFNFPDTSPEFKGIDSKILLKKTFLSIKEKGYEFGNADCTIIAEQPKLNPHIPEMQKILAEIIETSADNISIKATTNEKMGFTGREEGIAAYATALIYKPPLTAIT
jgi:2-C-methyl-D-erythritol 2,4-cyclodiphosphate synthase